jgi:hypothetical protein
MNTFFVTTTGSAEEENRLALLIDSLRKFGGEFSVSPFWIFSSGVGSSTPFSNHRNAELFPLSVEAEYRNFPLAGKVFACARAEELAAEGQSMVWMSFGCLIINPPVLFSLPKDYEAAFRPVHHKNIGSPVQEPPDGFWRKIYKSVGMTEAPFPVESYLDSQSIRPYFNAHCFSINTGRRMMRIWRDYFSKMIGEEGHPLKPFHDELKQIFLHQALLSTLLAKMVERRRILILPPEYSYPLHLHKEIPERRRFATLNELMCAVYEEKNRHNEYPDR